MKNINWKKLQPHLIAIFVFLGVSLIYCLPAFQGKQLEAYDDLMARGAAQEVINYKEATGEESLWTNGLFGGMPTYLIRYDAHNNLIEEYIYPIISWLPLPANFMFIAMICFYAMLLTFRTGPWVGIFGGLAYGLMSYHIIYTGAGHYSKVIAISLMPLLIAGIQTVFNKQYWWGAVLTAFAMAVEMRASHPQMTYYFFAFFISFYGLYLLVNHSIKGEFKHLGISTGIVAVALTLGLLTHMNRFLPINEYSAYSTRGASELKKVGKSDDNSTGLDRSYIVAYSFGKGDVGSLLIPSFKGGANDNLGKNKTATEAVNAAQRPMLSNFDQYWGGQDATAGPLYAGVFILFLCILAIITFKGGLVYAIVASFLITLFLSFGKNAMDLSNFFIDNFPMYSKFRAVNSILVVVGFCVPFLGSLMLAQIVNTKDWAKQTVTLWGKPSNLTNLKAVLITGGVTGTILVLMLLMPTLFQEFFKPGEIESYQGQFQQAGFSAAQAQDAFNAVETARIAIFKADALRTLLFVALSIGALYILLVEKAKKELVIGGLIALTAIDLWTVDRRYLNSDNFVDKKQAKAQTAPSPADQSILADKSLNYRVLNLAVSTFNDNTTSFHHKSIGGYHGAKMKRYQQLIENNISPELQAITSNITTLQDFEAKLQKAQILNMLNTRYIIMDPNQPAVPNPFAFGEAWLVNTVKWVDDADAEITALNEVNLRQTAVVDKRFESQVKTLQLQPDSTAQIQLTAYAPNHLEYSTNANTDQLAVFSEIFYDKGWKVTLDGNPVEHLRANFVLRALPIPKGKHTITFTFAPDSVKKGEMFSLASSAAIVLLALGGLFMEWRKQKQA